MIELDSYGSYHLRERGTVFAIYNPSDCQNFDHLQNQDVMIDGEEYHVTGVEFMAHAPPWKKGEALGLLVRGPSKPASLEG